MPFAVESSSLGRFALPLSLSARAIILACGLCVARFGEAMRTAHVVRGVPI
jgi:hypothetical protein